MSTVEIIATVDRAAAESTIDRLRAAGLVDLRMGDRRDEPIIGFALQWPGQEINIYTGFKTEKESQAYVSHCGDEKPAIIGLTVHSSYRKVVK